MVSMEPQQSSGSFLLMGYREFNHSTLCVRCNSSLQTGEVPMVIMVSSSSSAAEELLSV